MCRVSDLVFYWLVVANMEIDPPRNVHWISSVVKLSSNQVDLVK